MTPSAPSCPVRGCALVLARIERRWACAAGHSFDIARAGSLTLLQPQDKRSAEPGDSAEAVAARARALAAGAGDALAVQIAALIDAHAPAGRLSVLDIGCGEGFFLRTLGGLREIDACGLDLASSAGEAAARRMPGALIVIANADRFLPWPDGTFDVALSITSRRPAAEVARVLKPHGIFIVAVPADDDLIELREAILGSGERRDRLPATRAELARFDELEHRVARVRLGLEPEQQRDLMAATYRGARHSQEARLAELQPAEITLAQDLLALRPRREMT